MHHPTDRIAHTTTFVTPVVEHWLERELFVCFDSKNYLYFSLLSLEESDVEERSVVIDELEEEHLQREAVLPLGLGAVGLCKQHSA